MHLQYNSDKDFYISFNFTPVRKHIVSFLSIILNVLTNHMHTNVSLRLSYKGNPTRNEQHPVLTNPVFKLLLENWTQKCIQIDPHNIPSLVALFPASKTTFSKSPSQGRAKPSECLGLKEWVSLFKTNQSRKLYLKLINQGKTLM